MPRAIVGILDSFGIGGAPDAGDYSDGHGHPDTGARYARAHRRAL